MLLLGMARYWLQMAIYAGVGALSLWWLVERRPLSQQELMDCLAYIPGLAALGGWLRWRRQKAWKPVIETTVAWGVVGIAVASVFVFLIPYLR